ncbi:MAG TPA: phospholipase D-like domain-containing protein [Chitinophagales bacterium]|nr:phospholipase D-like domain-containing protein [Chitinophagales bacterium]
MKKLLSTLALIALTFGVSLAQMTIADARLQPVGTSVTVKGIALNGPELGSIRYIQDATGNIAVYSATLVTGVQRGDSITATGPLFNYNSLLEISPASSVTINSTGHPLPAPIDVTSLSGWVEGNEGKLLRISNATFVDAGTFSTAGSGTNYDVTDAAGTSQIRVVTTTNIDGTPIPAEPVFITGIMSQYAPGGTGGYQLLPRDLADISTGGNPPVISSVLTQTDITTSSFTVNFNTLYEGNTIIYYGTTMSLGSTASSAAMVTTHALNLTGLTAGTVYYVKAASVSASNDTSYSAITAMATASNSSGQIKVWFNNPVDNSVSTGTNATFVNSAMDDTVIWYLDHAKYSLDIAIYNIDNVNYIINSINDAYARGVDVRVICDNGVDDFNYGLINVGVGKKKKSPPDGSTNADGALYGIMHNKFIVVDGISVDPDDAWVLTGSMNFTDQQIKMDKQNYLAIQDMSLAKAYRLEFDEMFGGKFGPDKSNNTPHEFMIGGKRVEVHFSPSDEVETRMIERIGTADYDMHFAIYSFTRFGISYAIEDAVLDRGVFASGIWDETNADDSTAINVCEDAMGDRFEKYSGSNLLHHKYLIIDPNCPQSDPMVWTGSHNWSTSANSRNDENTIVIHDATVANLFYQEYMQRYKDEGATDMVNAACEVAINNSTQDEGEIRLYPNPATNQVTIALGEVTNGNIKIFDISGKVMLSSEVHGLQYFTININELPAGMYFVVCDVNGGNKTSKLIIRD